MNPEPINPVPAPTNETPAPVPVAPKYAGFWIRVVAYLVDTTILMVPLVCIQFSYTGWMSGVVFAIATWAYFILLTHYCGATLGKMLVGITVKSVDLQKLSVGRLILRETVGRFVSGIILSIGYIMAAFTEKKQGLHDYIAKSVVVYKDPSKPHTAGIVIGIIIALILPAIAILGIFASITLVSLDSARTKADDASTKARLVSLRSFAEVYFDQNNSYSQSSNCSSGMFVDERFSEYVSGIKSKKICHATGDSYAISAELLSGSFCVDSGGHAADGIAKLEGAKAMCSK